MEKSLNLMMTGRRPDDSKTLQIYVLLIYLLMLSWFNVGMLIFENFISRYENFRSRDSSSTRKLTRHSDVDEALNVWILRHSRHHAAQLWLGGGPWEVQRQGKLRWSQITKCSRLSHVLLFSDQSPDGCRPAPNNEQSQRLTGWAVCTVNGGISLRR